MVKLFNFNASPSYYLLSSSSFSQKNLKPASPPLFFILNTYSALSPNQQLLQSNNSGKLIYGGSFFA